MPRVPLSFVVSFSSEDPRHKVENLLHSDDGLRRWLSAAGDRSGRLEGVFQLERACQISHIDVGTHNVFTVQISVGRSSWPASKDYVTLLASTTFMSPNDCRLARNRDTLKMLNKEHFAADVWTQKWDRVKVVCSQPYRKDTQHGLSVLRVQSDGATARGVTTKTSPSLPEVTASSTPQSKGDFHKHFFGSKTSSLSTQRSTQLRESLAQIGATTENGSAEEAQYSRNTRLVLAAANAAGTPKYRPPSTDKPGGTPKNRPPAVDKGKGASPASERVINSLTPKAPPVQKIRVPFEVEVKDFLASIDVANIDVENFTFADLRHKFEKQKMRKLSKDERKSFFKKAQDFVEEAFSNVDGPSTPKSKSVGNSDSHINKTPSTVQKSETPRSGSTGSKRQMLIEKMQNVKAKTDTPGSAFSKPKVERTPKRTAIRRSLSTDLVNSGKDSVKIGKVETAVQLVSSTDRISAKSSPKRCMNLHTIDFDTSKEEILIEDESPKNPKRQNVRENRLNCANKEIVIDDSSPDPCVQTKKLTANSHFGFSTPNTSKRKNASMSSSDLSMDRLTKKPRLDVSELLNESQTITTDKKKKVKKCSKLHAAISFDSDSDGDSQAPDTNNMWLSRDSPMQTADTKKKSKVKGRGSGRGRGKGRAEVSNMATSRESVITEKVDDTETFIVGAYVETATSGWNDTQSQAANNHHTAALSTPATEEYNVHDNFVRCPLCDDLYSKQTIATHAARCGLMPVSASVDISVPVGGRRGLAGPGEGECPLCQNVFPLHTLEEHANDCLTSQDLSAAYL